MNNDNKVEILSLFNSIDLTDIDKLEQQLFKLNKLIKCFGTNNPYRKQLKICYNKLYSILTALDHVDFNIYKNDLSEASLLFYDIYDKYKLEFGCSFNDNIKKQNKIILKSLSDLKSIDEIKKEKENELNKTIVEHSNSYLENLFNKYSQLMSSNEDHYKITMPIIVKARIEKKSALLKNNITIKNTEFGIVWEDQQILAIKDKNSIDDYIFNNKYDTLFTPIYDKRLGYYFYWLIDSSFLIDAGSFKVISWALPFPKEN